MKELENLGRKHKVIPQAVPEVIESLIADRAVCMDKIGTQNIYWAFPSQRKAVLLGTKEKLSAEIETAKAKLNEAKEKSAKAKQGIKLSEIERSKILNETVELRKEIEKVGKDKVQLAKKDPKIHEAKLNELKKAKGVCDKMTDNICVMRQFLLRKFAPVDANAVDEQFGISPDVLEYFTEDTEQNANDI
jgi:hypothetical protein